MQAMLLAAGLGTRLWPLTEDRAKPAVPFLGRPLILGLVELLARHGFRRVVVNTHHLPGSIRAALAQGPETGLSIAYANEVEILGTAGGLGAAREAGLLDPKEPTLVLNAKLHTDLDLGALMHVHAARGDAVTLLLRPNPARERFREVLVEGDRVVGFGAGREPEGPSPLLFTGIQALSPEVLAKIAPIFSDTVADVYPPYIEARRVGAHIDARGRWWEFSTLERYLELHVRAHREGFGPDVSCSEGARVDPGGAATRAVLWEDARVERGARVEDAVLGRGVIVPGGRSVARAVLVRREHLREIPPGKGEAFDESTILVPIAPAYAP